MCFGEFRRVYSRCLNALTFLALQHLFQKNLIPKELRDGKQMGPMTLPVLQELLNSNCRRYYKALLGLQYRASGSSLPSQLKWNRSFGMDIPWDEVYHRYFRCTRNTALIWFQDKVVHRILTTNTFVSKFMDVSELCTFCLQERETIQHLMGTCIEVKAVWSSVKDMIRERLNVTLQLNSQEIIFGFDPDRYDYSSQIEKAIQRLVLIVKWYIYRCKVRKEKPTYRNMLHLLKFLTEAEFMNIGDQKEKGVMERDINMHLCCGQVE